jgi:hypothetical protein
MTMQDILHCAFCVPCAGSLSGLKAEGLAPENYLPYGR